MRKSIGMCPLLIIWALMIMKLVTGISSLEYLVLLIGVAFSVGSIVKNGIDKKVFRLLFPLVVLAIVQCIGIFNNCNAMAFRNIISVACIWGFSYCILTNYEELDSKHELLFYFISLLYLLRYVKYESIIFSSNVIAGCLIFLFFDYLIINFRLCEKIEQKRSIITSMLVWSVGILFLIFVYSTSSRTSLLSFLIILMTYIILNIIDFSKKTMNILYWVFVLMIFGVIVFYINIHNFSWYYDVDEYSQQFFGKSLDTSRVHLWRTELERLRGRWILGVGTGVLPQMERYAESSFHNNYIQILIQNGIIGLSCLVFYLYAIWKFIVKYIDTRMGKLLLSFLIGVIIYNCFEVTLLSNKIFLGMFQWFGLMLGINILRKNHPDIDNFVVNSHKEEERKDVFAR